MTRKEEINFDAALKALQSGKPIAGKDAILAPLGKQLTEAVLEAELDSHLAKGAFPNDNSPLKLLYMGNQNASKKCTRPIHHWKLT